MRQSGGRREPPADPHGPPARVGRPAAARRQLVPRRGPRPVGHRLPVGDRRGGAAAQSGGGVVSDLTTLQQQGRLSQTCPSCGLVEAAGSYCSRCLTRTGEATWFAQTTGRPRSATYPNLPRVQRLRILDRDGWVCQICHEPIDPKLAAGHPLAATIDHIVSVNAGGDWFEDDNLQAAHLKCNVAKGDGGPSGAGPDRRKSGINPGPGHPDADVAVPASRPSVDDLARAGERPARRDARLTPEAPDMGQALNAPALAADVPPSVASVRTPHPGQSSSARESAVRPAVAPVCRAGARDDKRSRRARAAHSLADPTSLEGPGGYALPDPSKDAGPDLSPGVRPAVLFPDL